MSRRLNKYEFQQEMNRIKRDNVYRKRNSILKAEKEKYKKSSSFETSKMIAVYLFILLNAIIIYSMIAMWQFADFSYLGVLITDIAAQVLIYAIYCMKAYHAKKQSELMKFDREKLQGSINDILNAGSKCKEDVPLTNGSIEVITSQDEAVG